MIIKFKNFIIEEDRNWFILTELWIVWDINPFTWEENKNAWEEKVISQCYPSTLEKCFEKILHKVKKSKTDVIELDKAANEILSINKEFIKELKEVVTTLETNQ